MLRDGFSGEEAELSASSLGGRVAMTWRLATGYFKELTSSMLRMSWVMCASPRSEIFAMTFSFPGAHTLALKHSLATCNSPSSPSLLIGVRAMAVKFGSGSEDVDKEDGFGGGRGKESRSLYSLFLHH